MTFTRYWLSESAGVFQPISQITGATTVRNYDELFNQVLRHVEAISQRRKIQRLAVPSFVAAIG